MTVYVVEAEFGYEYADEPGDRRVIKTINTDMTAKECEDKWGH